MHEHPACSRRVGIWGRQAKRCRPRRPDTAPDGFPPLHFDPSDVLFVIEDWRRRGGWWSACLPRSKGRWGYGRGCRAIPEHQPPVGRPPLVIGSHPSPSLPGNGSGLPGEWALTAGDSGISRVDDDEALAVCGAGSISWGRGRQLEEEHLQLPTSCQCQWHWYMSVPLSSRGTPPPRPAANCQVRSMICLQDLRGDMRHHSECLFHQCCVPRGKDGRQNGSAGHSIYPIPCRPLSTRLPVVFPAAAPHSEHNPRRDTLTHTHNNTHPLGGPSNTSDRRLFCCWGTWIPYGEAVGSHGSLVCCSAVVERGGGHGDPIT